MIKKDLMGQECYGIRGEMDMYHAPIIKRILDKLIGQGAQTIILDMSETDYIDSTGIGVAITTMKSLKTVNGRLVLFRVPSDIMNLLAKTNMLDFFLIADDHEDLEKVLAGRDEGRKEKAARLTRI